MQFHKLQMIPQIPKEKKKEETDTQMFRSATKPTDYGKVLLDARSGMKIRFPSPVPAKCSPSLPLRPRGALEPLYRLLRETRAARFPQPQGFLDLPVSVRLSLS